MIMPGMVIISSKPDCFTYSESLSLILGIQRDTIHVHSHRVHMVNPTDKKYS